MTADGRKQRAIEMLRACDVGDVAAIAALVSDDFRYEYMARNTDPSGDGLPGGLDRKTFLEIGVPGSKQMFRDGLNFAVDVVVGEGSHVALFGKGNAMTRDGKEYSNVYCWFFGFSGDKISLYREYCDTQYSHEVLFSSNLSE